MRAMLTRACLTVSLLASSTVASTVACSSPPATLPAPEHPSAPAAPAVPTDPMALLIGAPSVVVDLHLDRMRNSPLFAHARPFIDRTSCASQAELDWLSGVTERASIAARSTDEHVEWFAVLIGAYTEQDTARLLAAVTQRAGDAPGVSARQAVGRFSMATQAGFGASVLDAHTAVVGAQTWVAAALAAVDHPTTSFASSALWRDFAARCVDRALCLVAAADSFAARELQQGLSSLGAKTLGRELSAGDTLLGVSMPDDLQVGFFARLPSPDAAAGARQHLKDWLWQAGLVVRLAGLPDVLDKARLQTNANLLQVELDVRASDLAQYEQRLGAMLGTSADACTTGAAVAAP
jgi:hypothetical protein